MNSLIRSQMIHHNTETIVYASRCDILINKEATMSLRIVHGDVLDAQADALILTIGGVAVICSAGFQCA